MKNINYIIKRKFDMRLREQLVAHIWQKVSIKENPIIDLKESFWNNINTNVLINISENIRNS